MTLAGHFSGNLTRGRVSDSDRGFGRPNYKAAGTAGDIFFGNIPLPVIK